MCYSFETSIFAWFITLILCIFMLIQPKKYGNWIPLFILTFTQIQIMEAVIWTAIRGGNQKVNDSGTRILVYLLLMQPLMNSLLGYVNTGKGFLLGMTIMYGGIMIYHMISSRNDRFYSTVGPNGHLQWNRSGGKDFFGSGLVSILYLFGMFVPFLFMPGAIKFVPLIVGTGTFAYTFAHYNKTREFGSQWCLTATILSIATIVAVEFTS